MMRLLTQSAVLKFVPRAKLYYSASDGEDNNPRSSSEIYSYIGEPCMEKNITLYSIGLAVRWILNI